MLTTQGDQKLNHIQGQGLWKEGSSVTTAQLDRERRSRSWIGLWVVSAVMAIVMGGCATTTAPLSSVESAPSTMLPPSIASPASNRAFQPQPVDAATVHAPGPEGSYDPFAQPEETADLEEYDPWESFNAVMFEFNRKVDRYALKPVAQAYDFLLPDIMQVGVGNFFHNVRFVPRLMNNLFQAKAKGAGIELGRFLINSTVGVGGFFDPAKQWWGLDTPDEDSGQTLGVYGIKPGPYLVLPFFPPLTLRDGVGYVADLALDPINWLVFPIIEANGVPSAVAHRNRTTSMIAQYGLRAGHTINDRSLNLEMFEGVEDTTIDLYAAVRNAYLQKRAKAVRE